MTEIAALLEANREYAIGHENVSSRYPSRQLAVVTCMDARIDVFAALGLHLGESLIIRNAGGRVTEDVLRSLALAVHVLQVQRVVVMQHTQCGLAGVTDTELRAVTGADMHFLPIDDHKAALQEDLAVLAATPYLSGITNMAGFVYDVLSGHVEEHVRIDR